MFSSNTTQVSSGGYQISRSLRFNEPDTTYLNRTPASTGSRRTYAFSAWIKRSKTGTDSDTILASMPSGGQFRIFFQTSSPTDTLRLFSFDGTFQFQLVTTQVFRDFSAWGHLVVSVDTTQATAANRVRVYWNGVEITAFSTTTYPSQNADLQFNQSGQPHSIGNTYSGSSSGMYNGYMTEINFIDGQALTPSSFGETNAQTGVWQPKAYSGSYGTNGFYLNFSDNSNTTAATLGKDYSGNGNNWTPNNFSVTAGAGNDSLVDSPTSYGTDTGVGGTVRGNYATLNPLNLGANAALSNGNLDSLAGSTVYSTAKSTIGVSSGKWYVEGRLNFGGYHGIGVSNSSAALSSYIGSTTDSWGYWAQNGNKVTNASFTAYGATYTAGDIIGVALDMDAGTVTFYKNGTSQGTAFTGLTGTMFIGVTGDGSGGGSWSMNFGQRPFAYTAPSGFKALCTQNLPTPTIGATTATQAGKYFNPVLYTGNGTGQSITGVGFQPDFTWIKSRSNALSHGLYDAVRGVQKQLISDSTAAETTETTGLTAFGSDGFTTGLLPQLNTITATYVAWNWKANGSGSTNTSGSITSTVSANTTSGFSVVTYTGTGSNATVGHGLGVAPKLIITKNRGAYDWFTYHEALGNNKYVTLNTTGAAVTDANVWQSSNPTTSVFYVGANLNLSSNTYVNYCFAEVAGYSKFGSYNGTGTSDGPFVFTGFRPAYVLIKITTGAADWIVEDGTRNPYNVADAKLSPNTSSAEYVGASAIGIDFLSNGFKIRGTDGAVNTANTYIFAAFASVPLKFSLAR